MHLTTNDLPSVEAREHNPNVSDSIDSAREQIKLPDSTANYRCELSANSDWKTDTKIATTWKNWHFKLGNSSGHSTFSLSQTVTWSISWLDSSKSDVTFQDFFIFSFSPMYKKMKIPGSFIRHWLLYHRAVIIPK